LLAALLLILPGGGVAQVYETLATARAVVASVAPYPGYLQQVTDAAFGTPFMRVTGPGRQMLPGIFCKPTYCTHRYSSSRAWNADQSLLLIANGCSGFCFPDGSTYNGIYTWNPRLDIRTAVQPTYPLGGGSRRCRFAGGYSLLLGADWRTSRRPSEHVPWTRVSAKCGFAEADGSAPTRGRSIDDHDDAGQAHFVSTSRCIPPQLLWAATAAWHGPVQQSLWRCRLSDKQVRRQKDFIT